VAKERRQMPGLDWVARDTTYDAMGHVSTVSEWYDESVAGTPALTQYLGYDAFGRPTTIRPPGGASHDVTMSLRSYSARWLVVAGSTLHRLPTVTGSAGSRSHRFPRVTDGSWSASHRFSNAANGSSPRWSRPFATPRSSPPG